jgi:uroporphyrinogen-III synthase
MSAGAAEETNPTLRGKVVAVPEARQLDVLAGLLERRGATTLRCPLVAIDDHPDQAAVLAWIERLVAEPADLVVFYTGEGIERLLACAERAARGADFRAALARTPKLTRGPKPKRALRTLALVPEHEAPEPTTAGLLTAARAIATPRGRVAIQLYHERQDPTLVEHFRSRGVAVDSIAPYVYASAAEEAQVVELIGALAAGSVHAVAFTSTAQVRRLFEVASKHGLEPALGAGLLHTGVAAVGPVVRDELVAAGVRVDAMPEESFSMKPLVTSVVELLRGPSPAR